MVCLFATLHIHNPPTNTQEQFISFQSISFHCNMNIIPPSFLPPLSHPNPSTQRPVMSVSPSCYATVTRPHRDRPRDSWQWWLAPRLSHVPVVCRDHALNLPNLHRLFFLFTHNGFATLHDVHGGCPSDEYLMPGQRLPLRPHCNSINTVGRANYCRIPPLSWPTAGVIAQPQQDDPVLDKHRDECVTKQC